MELLKFRLEEIQSDKVILRCADTLIESFEFLDENKKIDNLREKFISANRRLIEEETDEDIIIDAKYNLATLHFKMKNYAESLPLCQELIKPHKDFNSS